MEALKTYFGYDAFRGGQEAVIDALFSGRDALAIMPTGAGKSGCYQIPALLLPGITLHVRRGGGGEGPHRGPLWQGGDKGGDI